MSQCSEAGALRIHLPPPKKNKTEKGHPSECRAERFCHFVPLSDTGGGCGHPCSLGPVATHQLHVSAKGCVALLVVLTGGFPPL